MAHKRKITDEQVEKIKYYSSLKDIAMNAKCYAYIEETYIDIWKKSDGVKAKYGDTNGNSFLVTKFITDISIFIYESITFINSIEDSPLKKELKKLYDESYYNNLKSIRNNIHLYNTYGSYKDKADNIINNQLKEFNMEEKDWLYPFRNDTSLIYKITNNKGLILGTDYLYKHYIFEVNGLEWTEEETKNYASTSAKILTVLSTKVAKIKVPIISIKNRDMHIEFFDYKSEELFKNIDIEHSTTLRLILILTELSYISILVDDILNTENLHTININWMLFLGKYVATKYDEALDSIENSLKYSNDKIFLRKLFNNNNNKSLDLRKFGQNLRNMLHFGLLDIKKQEYDGISKLELTELYLSKTNTDNVEEFITKYSLMRNDMKIIESKIRDALKVEKSF
ncbi:hypothetical protein LGK95_21595 [Clostridium algoriphilum]|uniref:hypothetical protein n=1 Tax=Clostridium algoriphilum TaxID=198347 RepID=UPI001CF1ACFD|nr:hypothetical protein [Clostridium algoriphilum]MCB2296047.1 hypothetical protein [Clostridium algoriphilum]